ncbi:MAG: serine/threonine-protein phosphatase [Deltaproteobacteria bacterium]|nr:serine/threonine-protein phosphatase [Candidatus Zymogenaceae bacterium]
MSTQREIRITAAGLSDVGRVREENEDGLFVRLIGRRHRGPFAIRAVLAVADGVGGHVGGRQASQAVVSFLSDLFSVRHIGAQALFGDDVTSFIKGIIREADGRVLELVGGGDAKPPGTTFTGAFIVGDRAYIGHIGDSRAYQIRNDEIIALTEDHSYVAHLVREGRLAPEEARDFPQKNVLMRSLGTEGGVTIDEPGRVRLMDGDVLVLCTDGLWDLVSEKELVWIIQEKKDLVKACSRLIRLANARDGHDNITVVAARFGRFRKGYSAPPGVYDPPGGRAPGRAKRMIARFAAFTGLLALSALLILIALFILNELSVVDFPLPAELLNRLISPS